ncbi:hemerythrin domain-containing protein [Enhydrobacter sp.]|jgi:hypothetical protein|uniref:hemerythrin domain-containing protein n=1 Tax=Enhydrobacter sp. TaxID=1894999 RepID=UPI00261C8ECF|nr:hemerythrin domain-containing protein [Enhydrobacter sp.]WIM11814.1 MAG: Repair of Iron Centers di-iron protein [Enhydrobacter sp.]
MAKSTKQSQSRKTGGTSQSPNNLGATVGGPSGSAIEMLKQDHRKVEGLFQQFEQSDDQQEKEQLADRICAELIVHTRLEEEIFYPACRRAEVEDDMLDEAQVEHDGAKVLINDLLDDDSDSPFWEAKVSVLKEMIKHHVAEEEKPDGVMAKAKENGIDESDLVQELKERKQELQERGIGRRPARPIALHFEQEGAMGRGMPDRDERGRFMSDEDDRSYRGGRYGQSERGGYRGHGGWYGDPEGHSEAARERWGESRRGGRHDYEDRRSGRGRYDEDYDDRRSGRHGGWYGDPRGHTAASHRGWEERRGEYDNDDDGRRGHGGWHGDPRGHAEASRRGWQHRR